METIDEIIIENIQTRMRSENLSQRALAREAKIDPVSLNRILKGKRGAGAETLERLAGALKCSVADFYQTPNKSLTSQESIDSRAETIASIVTTLASLDDRELRTILSTIQAMPSQRAKAAKSGPA